MPKYRIFSGPYFPVFGPKKLRIWTLLMQYEDQKPVMCYGNTDVVLNNYNQIDICISGKVVITTTQLHSAKL